LEDPQILLRVEPVPRLCMLRGRQQAQPVVVAQRAPGDRRLAGELSRKIETAFQVLVSFP
jgi:hypothetical protein